MASQSQSVDPLSGISFYADIDDDGKLDLLADELKPLPAQGKEQWAYSFYSGIHYPVEARRRGISGIVTLDVLVNALGSVESVTFKDRLFAECDEVAREAFLQATSQGFATRR